MCLYCRWVARSPLLSCGGGDCRSYGLGRFSGGGRKIEGQKRTMTNVVACFSQLTPGPPTSSIPGSTIE